MSRRPLIVGVVIALLTAGFLASPVAPAQPVQASALKTITAGRAAVVGPEALQPPQGTRLAARTTAWKPSGLKFSYQWYANSKKIKGATHSTYTVTAATACAPMRVAVTGTKKGYAPKTVMSPHTPVPVIGHAFGGRPEVSGTAAVGSRLTASAGSLKPKPQTLAAVWYRGSQRVATGLSYVPGPADAGQRLRVVVTATAKTQCVATLTVQLQITVSAPTG